MYQAYKYTMPFIITYIKNNIKSSTSPTISKNVVFVALKEMIVTKFKMVKFDIANCRASSTSW